MCFLFLRRSNTIALLYVGNKTHPLRNSPLARAAAAWEVYQATDSKLGEASLLRFSPKHLLMTTIVFHGCCERRASWLL